MTQEEVPTALELTGAAQAVNKSFAWIRKAVAAWLVATFLLFSSVVGVNVYKLNQVERVVTSHNAELATTLDAACTLIRSDPKLSQSDCPPVDNRRHR